LKGRKEKKGKEGPPGLYNLLKRKRKGKRGVFPVARPAAHAGLISSPCPRKRGKGENKASDDPVTAGSEEEGNPPLSLPAPGGKKGEKSSKRCPSESLIRLRPGTRAGKGIEKERGGGGKDAGPQRSRPAGAAGAWGHAVGFCAAKEKKKKKNEERILSARRGEERRKAREKSVLGVQVVPRGKRGQRRAQGEAELRGDQKGGRKKKRKESGAYRTTLPWVGEERKKEDSKEKWRS